MTEHPPEQERDVEARRAAIERERETRHWPIQYFRDEFGDDWPRAAAGIQAAADEAVDALLSERSGREEPAREESREAMRQKLVKWNAAQLETLQEVANAILDDRGAIIASPEEADHEA